MNLSLTAKYLNECVSPTFAKVWVVFTAPTAQQTPDGVKNRNQRCLSLNLYFRKSALTGD